MVMFKEALEVRSIGIARREIVIRWPVDYRVGDLHGFKNAIVLASTHLSNNGNGAQVCY